jgi:hypothetical protein
MSREKFLLYGGAGGGGKSWALLADAYARGAGRPGWVGVVFRARQVDVSKRGGIWDKAVEFFRPLNCGIRENVKDITFPGGGVLQFRHLDRRTFEYWRGVELTWAGFDEANEMQMGWIISIAPRLRSTIGVPPVARMTCNPDPDHALADWVSYALRPDGTADPRWSGHRRYFARSKESGKFVFADTRAEAARLSGRGPELVKTFAFIPALLEHNRILTAADPEYRGNLALQGIVVEAQLLEGNWLIRPETGGILRRSRWANVEAPLGPIIRSVRAWDTAASVPSASYPDPDFTAGPLLCFDSDGRFYVAGLAACREESPERDRLMEQTAIDDGPTVTHVVKRAPGDDGKTEAVRKAKILRAGGGRVVIVRESKAKAERAGPMARELEKVERDGEHRGFIWNRDGWLSTPYRDEGNAPSTLGRLFWSQVGPFWDPDAPHDDVPDALADAYIEGCKTPKRRRSSTRARARMSV